MECDQPVQLLQSLFQHESLLLRKCASLERCVEAVSHANSILSQSCSSLSEPPDDAGRNDMPSSHAVKPRLTSSSKPRCHKPVTSCLAGLSEAADHQLKGTASWKMRVKCLRNAVHEHSLCLKEAAQHLGLADAQSHDMHQQICQRQQALLKRGCMKVADLMKDQPNVQHPQDEGKIRPTDDSRVDLLVGIETLYAIRSKAAELEDMCSQASPGIDVRSAVASLEHLVSLQKRTMTCRSAGAVPKADVQMWRSRALRCMGVHGADGKASTQASSEEGCKHAHATVLSSVVPGFGQTAVFRHMKHKHASRSHAETTAQRCTDILPGVIWLPAEALDMMVTEGPAMSEGGHAVVPTDDKRTVSVLVSDAVWARAWFASLFQMQSLASELHMLRTTAPEILQGSTDIIRCLQTKPDGISQSRVAWLARLLHMILLPTARCTLSIGKMCQTKTKTYDL